MNDLAVAAYGQSCGRHKGMPAFIREYRSTTEKPVCNPCGEKIDRRVKRDKKVKPPNESSGSTALLDTNSVKRLTGFKSTQSIYTLMNDQNFPRPIGIGVRTKKWMASEVDQWIKEKIAESRNE